MLRLKKIRSINERAAFVENYNALSKTLVDGSYLSSSEAFGLWKRQTMIGGFVVKRGPQLRTLEALREPLNIDLSPIIEDLAEVTCLWIKAGERNFWTRSLMVVGIAWAIVVMRPKRIIAYTTKPKLHAGTYSALNLSPIFTANLKDTPQPGLFYTINPYVLVLSLPKFLLQKFSKAHAINTLGVKNGYS